MKKIVLTLAAVSALTATAAAAQPGYGYNDGRGPDFGRPGYGAFAQPGVQIDAKQAMLAQRIDAGVRNGALTRREAANLRAEMARIQRTEDQFRRSRPGLTGSEIAQLDARLDRLSLQIRFDRHDRDYRQYGQGYGYDNRRW